jgi:hypothetical protein
MLIGSGHERRLKKTNGGGKRNKNEKVDGRRSKVKFKKETKRCKK